MRVTFIQHGIEALEVTRGRNNETIMEEIATFENDPTRYST